MLTPRLVLRCVVLCCAATGPAIMAHKAFPKDYAMTMLFNIQFAPSSCSTAASTIQAAANAMSALKPQFGRLLSGVVIARALRVSDSLALCAYNSYGQISESMRAADARGIPAPGDTAQLFLWQSISQPTEACSAGDASAHPVALLVLLPRSGALTHTLVFVVCGPLSPLLRRRGFTACASAERHSLRQAHGCDAFCPGQAAARRAGEQGSISSTTHRAQRACQEAGRRGRARQQPSCAREAAGLTAAWGRA